MAMKLYTCSSTQMARADWKKEWKNNVIYSKHPHIIPILASIAHGEVYMNFYSLCDGDLQALFSEDPKPTDHRAEFVWGQFMGLLSALDHIHESIPGGYGYHFDIKTPNILVWMEKWIIADLGLVHRKDKINADFNLQRKNNEIATSTTERRPGSEEFAAPEKAVKRKFDVWGMGCVGCITFAWLRKGAKGVKQFRDDRKQDNPEALTTVLYNFYRQGPGGPQLHPAVEKLLSEATDDLSKGVAGILRDMLSIIVDDRPTAQQAEKRFAELLDIAPLEVLKPPERSISEFVPESCISIRKAFRRKLGENLNRPRPQGMVLVYYRHNKMIEFFTPERITALWRCNCEDCPNETPTAAIIGKIRGESITTKSNGKIRQSKATYVGVLAFLLVEILDIRPIVKFMERGFSDQKLAGSRELDSDPDQPLALPGSKPPISQQTFNNLVSQDSNGPSQESDYSNFFKYFIVNLWYEERYTHRHINENQILPFNVTKEVGMGGYSVVYKAVMLKGFHDFFEKAPV